MPTLYYAVGACSLTSHITLEWIGAPYEAVRVQYGSKELLAINPAGAVPTIRENDGWLLTQAGAILEYLAHDGRDTLLDGGRSVIDAYSFPMICWAIKLLPGGLKEYANAQALHDRIAADPAVQNVLARETGG